MAGEQQRGYTSKNKALNDFIFASDLFRKVKEVRGRRVKRRRTESKVKNNPMPSDEKRWASDRKEIGIGLISEQFFLCQFLDRTIL